MSNSLVKTIANIITTTLIGYSVKLNKPVDQLIDPDNLLELAKLFDEKQINNQGLLKAIDYMIDHEYENPKEVVKKLGLIQVNDESTLLKYVQEVISQNKAQVAEYQKGKVNVIGFLVGRCMQLSNKSGNPAKFKELLEQELIVK